MGITDTAPGSCRTPGCKLDFGQGVEMKEPTQFLTNEKGERIAVVISIEEYEELIEKLEDAEDILAIEEAKASGEVPIPLEEALAENRLNRK